MANNSDTEVWGSKRISWQDVSLGSKKENSVGNKKAQREVMKSHKIKVLKITDKPTRSWSLISEPQQ